MSVSPNKFSTKKKKPIHTDSVFKNSLSIWKSQNTIEALSRTHQTDRHSYNPNPKAILANQKPEGKLLPYYHGLPATRGLIVLWQSLSETHIAITSQKHAFPCVPNFSHMFIIVANHIRWLTSPTLNLTASTVCRGQQEHFLLFILLLVYWHTRYIPVYTHIIQC